MTNIGTMKDIYIVARHVNIPGEAIDRFVKTLEAAGYEVNRKVSLDKADGLLRALLSHEWAEDCQECAIGKSEAWAKAKAYLDGCNDTEGKA